ncbi:hypothetical protein ACRE_034060 [Hapsidospora chrysogenum ATCC 11550]|uniref:Uncharacterized protein n=1 Tax=Hapsidospora chrysogenum (strain ATCC 11550 / CBS 779.69 / DSM 880 / IAM 14645 / JCM 23072 / IMI 49137) TaxID=857340 RepID=A0A086T8S7_HAPC1|nr:hypothetical protein ACRE_034060 [Hapsidospora chrysogenum ATCC 11550]
MFCSSLRRKREWAPALRGSADPAYIETRLETHDIAFPVSIRGDIAVFRGVLVSTREVGASQTKQRLERLRLLDGGSSVFAVLLLDGDSFMGSLTKLQMEYVAPSQSCLFCWLTIFYMAVSLQGLVAIPSAHLPPKLQPGRSETDETMMRTRRALHSSRPGMRKDTGRRSEEALQEAAVRVGMQHTALILVHTAETVGSVRALVERTVWIRGGCPSSLLDTADEGRWVMFGRGFSLKNHVPRSVAVNGPLMSGGQRAPHFDTRPTWSTRTCSDLTPDTSGCCPVRHVRDT